MAIFGIGAYWDGDDKTDEFVKDGTACVGWWPKDAPSLYALLKTIKTGDIIYIKSTPPRGEFRIKAIGMVINEDRIPYDDNAKQNGVSNCLTVKWLWHGEPIVFLNSSLPVDPYNVRNNTLYEEFSPFIHNVILKKIGMI